MSIAVHQMGLRTRRHYLEQKENEIALLRQRCATYERQIQLAISKGKDGFDADKFGLKV